VSLPSRPCKHCHRPIALVLTATGRRMPVDPQPAEGTVYLAYEYGQLVATVARKGEPEPEGVAYVSHWVTCPALKRRKKPVVEQHALDLR